MDSNLHNDNLEGFLRKSFEQYDDSPSDGLWDKIETDLAVQPKVRSIGTGQRWWIGMAAAAVLALVIGQCVYFKNEKTALVEIINKQNDRIEKLEEQLINEQKGLTEIPTSKNNKSIINTNKNQYEAASESDGQKTAINNVENSIYQKEGINNSVKKQTERLVFDGKEQGFLNANVNTNANANANANADLEYNFNTENINDIEPIVEQHKLIAPQLLDLLGLKKLKEPDINPALRTITIIEPVPGHGHFSVGMHHTYLSTRENLARVIQRPMGGPSRVFNNTKAMTGITQLTGISAIYQTKNNWLIESGMQYRATNLSTMHRAQLFFQDRRTNSSNGQHDFQYALNTSAGLVDIEVRADQSDPDETIDEFERIIIEIEAKQKVDYVSIPFLVGHQFGHGRLNASIKTGILVNFLTHQSFDISGNIINSRFRNSATSFSQRNGLGLKNTTSDFMAAAGLNYGLNQKWIAHISPTIIVPMGNRHNDPYIKSSGFSAGVDIGFDFKF